jgi:uncharacterized membrane protein
MADIDLSLQSTHAKGSLDRLVLGLNQYWFFAFGILFGLYAGLPFLAPVFMNRGWESSGKIIYLIYSFLCHQLPERSLFLFGPKTMYSLTEIQASWHNTLNPLVLRQFNGDPTLGWKVAWSDRMIAMYGSILLFALFWWPLRHRVKPLSWWGFLILLLPMALDGTAHLISDIWGVEQGFRQTNLWLQAVTLNSFPGNFYEGNVLGSFNSWMRWLSGLLFGLGIVWFGFPYLNEAFLPRQSHS